MIMEAFFVVTPIYEGGMLVSVVGEYSFTENFKVMWLWSLDICLWEPKLGRGLYTAELHQYTHPGDSQTLMLLFGERGLLF